MSFIATEAFRSLRVLRLLLQRKIMTFIKLDLAEFPSHLQLYYVFCKQSR